MSSPTSWLYGCVLVASFVCVQLFHTSSGEALNKQTVLRPLNGATSGDTALIFLQGADIPCQAYVPLARAIQESFNTSLYVGLPAFATEKPFDEEVTLLTSEILDLLHLEGLTRTNPNIFFLGHSLGGQVLQSYSYNLQFSNLTSLFGSDVNYVYKGQILLNAFINRKFRNNDTQQLQNYSVPTLSIGGELDGLVHSTRMIEQYYIQIVQSDMSLDSITNFPVVLIAGLSHMQPASITGNFSTPIPSFVLKNDLKPRISYDSAHEQMARFISAFMHVQLAQNTSYTSANSQKNSDFYSKKSKNKVHADLVHAPYLVHASEYVQTLVQGVNVTQQFGEPMIQALIQEGYYHFKLPCNCEALNCPSQWNCLGGSPWSANVSQYVMSGLYDLPANATIRLSNNDSFHPTYQTNPIHYANIYNNCSSVYAPNGCTLHTSTVTQNKYNLQDGEDLDDGGTPQSAYEMRTKMKSMQSIYTAVNAGEIDEPFDICYEINQASIDYALDNAPQQVLDRYNNVGELIVVGSDIKVAGGPDWTFPPLNQSRVCDTVTKRYVNLVRSQYLYTKEDCKFVYQEECGVHYCKVLSPARAMEWLYVDSLRFNLSLASIANGTNGTYCE